MSQINWNSADKAYGTVFKGDEGLIITFYVKSVQDIQQSERQGVPIYRDAQFVKIFRAGEMMNVIDRPVQEYDKIRFRHQWEQFQLNKTQLPEGTPIELLFPNHPSISDTLKSYGVYTIQQCAGLTAHAIDRLGMGGQEYVNRAQAYIDAAKDGKNVIAMQEDLKKKDAQIRLQQKQIDELIQQVRTLMTKSNVTTTNPNGTMEAPFMSDVDPQTDRIANTHVTRDIASRHKR